MESVRKSLETPYWTNALMIVLSGGWRWLLCISFGPDQLRLDQTLHCIVGSTRRNWKL
jgi:hypothetical protein